MPCTERKNMARSHRTLMAGCKVNLFLRIVCRRADGYHELETLFLPLPEPHDTLTVNPREDQAGLRLTCSTADLADDTNLVARAYAAFTRRTGLAPGLDVHLEKRIPTGAGLGGGSSDAAALLAFLNETAGPHGLPMSDLAELGAQLGADVPYFLLHGQRGEPALATGIGQVLTPARVNLDGYTMLLVCPATHVSTSWAYAQWDRLNLDKTCEKPWKGILTAGRSEASNTFCPETMGLANDFEEAIFPTFPQLAQVKGELIAQGAAHAVMSGSGAAIFALFRNAVSAEEMRAHYSRRAVSTHLFHFPSWGVAKW